MAHLKYLAVPATFVAVGGVAAFYQGPSVQWAWITGSATALVLAALLVGDLVGFFERQLLRRSGRD